MGCLKVLVVALVLPVLGWFAGGWVGDLVSPQPWEVVAVGDAVPVTLAGGTYGLFESAAYQSDVQLVGPADDRVVERAPAREDVRTRSDRVFRLSAVVSVTAGEYTLRSTRSPFSNPQALVAVGEEPIGAWQRDLGYGAGGALLLLVGGTVVLVRTRRGRT